MKKEAINTFGDGLIMDLHPLTTPNSVLTNCLNGTIITYNGNEFVLQNDIGNGKVGTAYLDKGYVPVGIKEHGGIIYVASHNPITGKSQIGSFPSPQQLFNAEDLNIKALELSFGAFIGQIEAPTGSPAIPSIKLEHYKTPIFQDSTTGKDKIFHPGDNFVITTRSITSNVLQGIKDGFIQLRLGVVNKDGTLEYLDNNSLRQYSYTINNSLTNTVALWIYPLPTNVKIEDILRTYDAVQVFTGKSSGALVVSVELQTFDTFNLYREYSEVLVGGRKEFQVEFLGETTSKILDFNKKIGKTTLVHMGTDTYKEVAESIQIHGVEGKTTYTILPACTYGALPRMKKSGIIDFDSIRANKQEFTEWRFFITETYLKIGWGYDYYNMDKKNSITRMEFDFISLNKSYYADAIMKAGASNKSILVNGQATKFVDYTYSITKEYFNGNFEDIIPFSNGTIQKDWVYIVRILRYIGLKAEVVGYKTIYTAGYFNQFYENVPNFDTGKDVQGETQIFPIGEDRKKDIALKQVNVKVETSSTINIGPVTYAIRNLSDSHFIEKTPIASDYVKTVSGFNAVIDSYQFITRKTGTYDIEVTPIATWDFKHDNYVGYLDDAILNNAISKQTIPDKISNGSTQKDNIVYDNSNIGFTNIVDISSSMSVETKGQNFKYNELSKSFKASGITTSRLIGAQHGEIIKKPRDVEKLVPVYETNMDKTEKDKLFAFREDNAVLYCSGMSKEGSYYNTRVYSGSGSTKGSDLGNNTGVGRRIEGLRSSIATMGNGTIGIMAGCDGDNASYRVHCNGAGTYAWYGKEKEIDSEDNFLIAVWRCIDGNHYVINLASQKTDVTKHPVPSGKRARVDLMLRCFLSQMLIAKRVTENIYYVGPNMAQFTYHTRGNIKGTIPIPTVANDGIHSTYLKDGVEPPNNTKVDYSIEGHMNRWSGSNSTIINYLPLFKVVIPGNITTNVEFGDNIRFDDDSTLLGYYNNAYSNYMLADAPKLSPDDKAKIFIGVGIGVNEDGSLKLDTNPDGTYKRRATSTTIGDWMVPGALNDLGYDINKRFVTSYSKQIVSGDIPEGYYNEVMLASAVPIESEWVNNKDRDAPGLCELVKFGTKFAVFR